MSETQPGVAPRRRLTGLLVGMILRPRSALEYVNLAGRRTWWLLAALAVVFLMLPIGVGAPITARQAREAIVESQKQVEERVGQQMTQEQMNQALSITASPLITLVFPALGGTVVLAIGWLLRAGALYLAGLAVGGRSTFGAMFRVTVWTWLPYAVRGLIRTIYILVSGQGVANEGLSGYVVGTGLGALVLKALLGHFDLFLVWNLALLVIGVVIVTRLSTRKAVLVTVGVWVILTLLGLIPALIGGLFAQQTGGLS
ncbi:YIP1 family protein [bacterium]|nr:YIP1 family protein [bacterium]